jgi:hypothetical protein
MIGYRCEEAFGDGVTDLIKVMAYETFELGNSDILEYVSMHYLEDGELKDECLSMIQELEDNGYVDDMFEDEKEEFMGKLVNEINKKLNMELKSCLWLASLDTVKDYYCQNMDSFFIKSYETSNAIITDLGYDGALYAYEVLPKMIKQEEYRNENR